jgi:hypothetical protein
MLVIKKTQRSHFRSISAQFPLNFRSISAQFGRFPLNFRSISAQFPLNSGVAPNHDTILKMSQQINHNTTFRVQDQQLVSKSVDL